MAIAEKALSEGGSAAALVPPKYGVGDKCPNCGMAMARMPSGEVACKNCGYGLKKAVGFVVDTAESKSAHWSIKEAQRDGITGLYIKGYASTWMEDRDGDTVARDAFDATLKSYLEDNPVLLLDHKRDQILGDVTKGWVDDTGLGIEAFIPKPERDEEKWKITAYRDIKRGLRKALSIGGVFYRAAEKSTRNVITKVDLYEISNIAVPSNPKSLFRVIAEKGLSFGHRKAELSSDARDNLPDSAFADPGERRYPHHHADGSLDLAHLRNALSRCGQSQTDCPPSVVAHLEAHANEADVGGDKGWRGPGFLDEECDGCPEPGRRAVGNSDEENANALKHTHAKVGGGTETHQHRDAEPNHDHEGLLPMPKGKAALRLLKLRVGTKAADDDPDDDAASLAQAIDAALDEAIEELDEGDTDQARALVVAAEQTVDSLLELLNASDPEDAGDDAKMARRVLKAAAQFPGGVKADGNEQALIDYWTQKMGEGEGQEGDFDDCVDALADKQGIDDPQALCAWIHKQATGYSPGHAPGEQDKTTVQGGRQTMGDEIETKGAKSTTEGGDGSDSKTVTLSKEEFARYQKDIQSFNDMKHQKEVEETAEQIAADRLKEEEAKEAKEQAAKQSFANEVAQIVEAKLASSRSGRKYVVPQSGGSVAHERGRVADQPNMIELLYRKSQCDQEARQELREMSQKAAAEFGLKALAEGGTSGYLVPPQYMQQGIAEYRIAAAKVRQLCTVIGGIGTNLVYIPRETGIATVGWTSEGAPKPSTDQTFGQLAVNIFTLAGISKVSRQLLDDSSPAVDMLVRKDLGRLLGQAEDIAFLVGTGAGQPTGILNTTGILSGALGAATIADALASAIAAVQANYYGDPEAIVMNPKHLNVIRTAKDSNLRYIFEPSFFAGADPRMRAFMENNGPGGPGGNLGGGFSNMPTQGGPQGTVWGLPVYADANLPAPTNLGNIIVGAFSEAYVLERQGVTIDVSSEAGTSFEQNQVWFRGEERLGFTAARQPTAFYAITTIP